MSDSTNAPFEQFSKDYPDKALFNRAAEQFIADVFDHNDRAAPIMKMIHDLSVDQFVVDVFDHNDRAATIMKMFHELYLRNVFTA